MNTQLTCVGIPAAWINGWLAGVGATVLDSRIRLHWFTDSNCAVLSAHDVDPLEVLVASWPSQELLASLPIAEHWKDAGKLGRQVTVESFSKRTRATRTHPQSWALSSTMTDLCVDKNNNVQPAPFNPPAPKGLTLHDRLIGTHHHVRDPSQQRIRASLMGEAVRAQVNGLGFDQSRLGSQADTTKRWTDPVLEVMAFFGLALLPMRGRGYGGRLARSDPGGARQRGWRITAGNGGGPRFTWPAWSHPLDADGIDALLDVWSPARRSQWPLVGVHAAWRTVEFRSDNPADPTRGFGAERL